MTRTDELLDNARAYAESFTKGDLPMPPGLGVAVVACMDARPGSTSTGSWDCPRAMLT